jgi:hypothetical protein
VYPSFPRSAGILLATDWQCCALRAGCTAGNLRFKQVIEVPEISIRENRQGCSRLITATRVELGKARPDKYGVLDVCQKSRCLSVAVSEPQVHRTLLILDTLIREFEKGEVTIIPVSEEKLSRLVVGSENIRFYVREQSKQTIEKGTYFGRHVSSAKGKLSFVLGRCPSRAWHDGKEQRLEALLGEIVVRTFQFAEVLRADRLEWEEKQRRREAERRLRELQEEARKKEETKQRAFHGEVEQWNHCRVMREYIAERERALEG